MAVGRQHKMNVTWCHSRRVSLVVGRTLMDLEEYIRDLRPTLTGYFILKKLFPEHVTLTTPYPPAELTDVEVEALKARIDEAIPTNSMIVDLWDWDLHFERDLSDDWYFSAAFGPESLAGELAEELADYFLEKIEEYGLDYDQYNDPEVFSTLVITEAKKFITEWRNNIEKKCAQPAHAPRQLRPPRP